MRTFDVRARWRFTSLLAALFVAIAAAAPLAPNPAPAAAATPVTITYEVRGKGNTGSLERFAALAAQTLDDPRGWGLGGSIRFVRVAAGGSFTLWLSAPQYVPTFASGCSSTYSCRVGRNVIINEARFDGATTAWTAVGGQLRDYQHMVVNHETGHWLGFGHATCPAAGQPAPVMQQQSKGLLGCRPNPWPTAAERGTLARWRGVPIIVPQPGPPPAAGGAVVRVPVAGAAASGVPVDAQAVGVNLTVTQPTAPGYVTAFPCGGELPPTSNLNYAAGQTIAAFALVAPGAGGAICLRTAQPAHLVVDISGYVPAGSTYTALSPQRLLDTRSLGSPAASAVAVALPAGTGAAALTVTVTQPAGPGYITVYPCGSPVPTASVLNFAAGQTIANSTLAKAGPDGRVCLRPSTSTHLIVDLVGTFPPDGGYTGRPPLRLIDTRVAASPPSVAAVVALPDGNQRALNLTVTGSASAGWARAYPCDGPQPATSNINFAAGQTVANALVAGPGAQGSLCLSASTPVHFIVDDSGSLAPSDYRQVAAVRLLDTRRG